MPAPAIPYTTRWLSRNVVAVDLPFEKCSDEFWFLITSDVHWDNAHCDRAMYKRHLDEAVQRNAGIIDNGDAMCLMQGRYDPRSDQTQLRPEHRGEDYLDRVLETYSDFLAPYADRLAVMGHGNHETNVRKRQGVDMTERVCAMLKARHNSPARCHGYGGWVQFFCKRNKQSKRITLYRHHGSGGASPVTRGVISTNRIAVSYPDAHIVVTGHDHNEWIVPIPRVRLTQMGKIQRDEQLHCRVPGYSDGLQDGFEGWVAEKHAHPKTKGSLWLRIFWRDQHFKYECTRAQ